MNGIRQFLAGIQRFIKSLLQDLPDEIYKASIGIMVLIVAGGITVHLFELADNPAFINYTDSIWWAIVTVTTTGYGDITPQTGWGRLVAGAMMLAGIVVISLLTASISSILVSRKIQTQRGLMTIKAKNHIIICGYYQTLPRVVRSITTSSPGTPVVLLNDFEQDGIDIILSEFSKSGVQFVRGNQSSEVFLEKAQIKTARAVLILPDKSHHKSGTRLDEMTLMTVMSARQMNPDVKIFAHVSDPDLIQHLKRAGVDGFLLSDEFSGEMMASFILQPGTTQTVKAMLSLEKDTQLKTREIPRTLVGKTYGDLLTHFKAEHNLLVIGFMSQEADLNLESLLSNDMSALDQFIQKKFREAGFTEDKADQIRLNLNPALSYVVEANDLALVIGG